ncbi:MAG: hypothetical protein DRP02_12595 [Candidatus Gerdarchaeota archaeon]|nr:MAG: hypothetical protein DRP02_12595 [Candidatus Gerdarchaeota archaeon]
MDGVGRPTKELYSVLGVLVLQQIFDLTDEETCSQVAYNTRLTLYFFKKA